MNEGKSKGPVVLLVLDGWGIAPDGPGNAIALAKKPNFDRLLKEYPNTKLEAAGEAVGLPMGEDGNSEVGHLNIGAGRVVLESLPRINMSIVDGTFFSNKALMKAVCRTKEGASLHLMGLVGSGGVHAYSDHLFALIQLAKREKLEKVYLHLFTDGRDSTPTEGKAIIKVLEDDLVSVGVGKIATLIGRYYAMDRDLRWERTEKAYEALTEVIESQSPEAIGALEKSYQRAITDEFVEPVQIGGKPEESRIKDGDAVIFFNFRIDRPRQLTKAFVLPDFENTAMEIKGFDPYETTFHKKHIRSIPENTPFRRRVILKDLVFVTMTEYEPDLPVEVAYPHLMIENTLGEIISGQEIEQLRLAETEKERFVTFYLNGGMDGAFKGEDRLMIPSPKVATYDLKPEMSTPEITTALLEQLDKGKYGFLVVNFACPDMVAHTGKISATIKAVEAVDEAIGRIVKKIEELGGVLVITADHGNAEEMQNGNHTESLVKGDTDTEHSTYPVPLIVVWKDRPAGMSLNMGVLGDVAPTVLKIMGIEQPEGMFGKSLF